MYWLIYHHHHHLFCSNQLNKKTHTWSTREQEQDKKGTENWRLHFAHKKEKNKHTRYKKNNYTTTHTVKRREIYAIKWPFKFRQWWKVNGMRQKVPNIYNFDEKVSSDWAYTSRFIQLKTMSSCVCHSAKREQVGRTDMNYTKHYLVTKY